MASSLKVLILVATPVRGASVTSVGGSTKFCRIATATLPSRASDNAPNDDAPVTATGAAPRRKR